MPRSARLRLALGVACALALTAGASPAAAQRIAPPPTRTAADSVASRRAADAWLAEDKVQHFAASAAVTTLAYGGARIAMSPQDARAVAIGAGVVAGLLKEVHDYRRGTIFSFRDLVWDGLGIAVGYFWIREIQ